MRNPRAGLAAERQVRWTAEVTIQDLGSIGELVAAVATVATLIYLAVQIRGNTRALRSEALDRTMSMHHSEVIGSNRQAAEVFTRGLTDFDSLDPIDRTQFHFLFSMLASRSDEAFQNYQAGLIDRNWMEGQAAQILRLLRTRGGAEYWRLNKVGASPDFQKFVEERLAAVESNGAAAAQQGAAADSA